MRLIEIPDDGVIRVPIMSGEDTVGKRCIDLSDFPTVDAVPVVRCKNCKYFNLQSMECENDAVSTDHEGGASYSLNFYLDDFCSYGERKDNE